MRRKTTYRAVCILLFLALAIGCTPDPPHAFEIQYHNLDGATNHTSNPSEYTVESATITLRDPTRSGYTFAGWYTNSEFTGTAVTQIPQGSSGIKHFYAKWTANTYQVSFLSQDDGIANPNSIDLVFGQAYGTLPVLTKAGYQHTWNTTQSGSGSTITSESILSIPNDHTLYACWEVASYSISYHLDNGTNHRENPSSYTTLSSTITLQDPTRTGYTFGGWFDNANLTGTEVTTIAQGSTGDISLYAKWTANSYTVTLDRQPSSDGTASVSATFNAAMPAATEPTRTGYTFGGYFTETSGGGVQYYTASMASARNWDIAGNTTLYAKWTPVSYAINYSLNNGTNHGDNPSSYTTLSNTITLQDPTRTGYTFGGWFDNANLTGTEVTTIAQGSTGDISLYAKWTANSYTVTLDRQPSSDGTASVPATYDGQMPTASAPTRTGYTFGGYYTGTSGSGTQYYSDSMASARNWDIAGNTTLYAKWTPVSYAINYSLNNGTNHGENPSSYTILTGTITLQDPTRTGYTFGGWFDNTNLTGTEVTTIAQGSTGDISLYAKWIAIDYTITYTLNNGTNHGENPSSFTILSSTITLKDPTRTGYTFAGWFTNSAFIGDAVTQIAQGSTGDRTLYAKWTANTYTVTLNRQPSSDGTASVTAIYNAAMPTASVPSRTGYTFGGYFTETSGGGVQYYTASMASARNWDIAEDTTLYAKWTANSYTVTLDRQPSSNGTASVTATYDGPMPEASAPTRTGYTFGGYFTETSGGGVQYYTASMASDRNWDIAGNTTLYAKWIPNTYTVTLDRTLASDGTASVTATYDGPMPTASAPTRTGYAFGGYYTATLGAGTQYYSDSMASTKDWDIAGDTTLYAKWTLIDYLISYELYGGVNHADNPATYTIVSETITLENPTRTGYTFGGWFVADDYSGTSVSQIVQGSHEDIILHAKWTPIVYTITYTLNGGTAPSPDNRGTYTIETDSWNLASPTRDYYTFNGWYANAGFTGNSVEQIAKGSHGDLALYAKWVPIEYTITYSLKGEANDPDNPTTYTVETETFELGEASLSGHYFAGWYTSHDHTFNTLVWKIETGSHGDIVLYPKTLWEYEIGDMTPAPDYEFVIIDRNDQENNLTPYDYREADTWRYIVAKNYDSSYISDLLIPWTPAGEVDHFFNPSIGGDQGPYGDIGQGKDAPQSVIDYYGTGPDLEYACYAAGSSPGYFLPSLSEMVKLMELMRDRSIGGISIGIPYWTATDVTNEHLAYSVVLQQPDPTKEEFTIEMPIIEKTNEYRVRPMRRI